MGIKFKQSSQQSNNNNFLPPEGTHFSRCFKMIHVGERPYEQQGEKKTKNSLWVWFELPTEMRVFKEELGEQPMSVNIEYNHVPYETAKIIKHINSWRGKALSPQEIDDFDVSTLLGQPCMITIVHNTSAATGKTYANINTISGIPKGLEAPKQINKSYLFDYNDNFDLPNMENNVPQFLQDIMKDTPDWKEKMNETTANNNQDTSHPDLNTGDDLPF